MNEKPVILFESYPDFNGSPLEIYNELIRKGYDKKYDLIWAVYSDFNRQTNYKIIKFFNCENKEKQNVLARTKIIIDSNRYIQKPSKNCYRIHVRHGSPLKKVTRSCNLIGPVDAILTTSKQMLDCDKLEWPSYILDKFIITGYPATDKLFSPHNLYNCGFIKEITGEDKRYNKIIGWLPTYRQYKTSNTRTYFPYGLPVIKTLDDYEKINKVLTENNILLIIQQHHAQANNYKCLENKSNIKFVNEDIKLKYNLATTDLLGNFDALITDYSAAYHEYIILNRPIALTIDDLVEFSRNNGFIINYLEWIKGDYILGTDDLNNWFNDIVKGIDKNKSEREKALHKIHDHIDNKSTERVVNFLIENGIL